MCVTLRNTLSRGRSLVPMIRLRWRSWEAQDGQLRTKHEVLATNVQFLTRSDPAMGPEREPNTLDEVPF